MKHLFNTIIQRFTFVLAVVLVVLAVILTLATGNYIAAVWAGYSLLLLVLNRVQNDKIEIYQAEIQMLEEHSLHISQLLDDHTKKYHSNP